MLCNLKDTLSYFNSFLFFYLGRYWFCWNVFKYKIDRKDRKSLVHYKSSWIWCPRKPQALKKCITFSLKKVCCLSSAFCRVSFRVFRKGYTFLAEYFQTWNLAKRFADSFGNNKNGWGNFWFFWFKPKEHIIKIIFHLDDLA